MYKKFLILCLFLINFSLNVYAEVIIIENIYSEGLDKNLSIAKDKAFNNAMKNAIEIVLKHHNLPLQKNNYILTNAITSYQIKEEKIENDKYTAFFNFAFDEQILKGLVSQKEPNIDKSNRRIIFSSDNYQTFDDLVKELSLAVTIPNKQYKDTDRIYNNDILFNFTKGEGDGFIISIEVNNKLINISGANLEKSFLIVLDCISKLVNEEELKDKNFLIMHSVANISDKISIVRDELSKFFKINNITIVAYQAHALPIYLIELEEEDDLLLEYAYTNNDYILSDLRIFKQFVSNE
jgi:hypothetical protein